LFSGDRSKHRPRCYFAWGCFRYFWLGAQDSPPSPSQFQSVFAFAALKLRRTPRFALPAPPGCAARSPKGEAWWARQIANSSALPSTWRLGGNQKAPLKPLSFLTRDYHQFVRPVGSFHRSTPFTRALMEGRGVLIDFVGDLYAAANKNFPNARRRVGPI
jgi:hypothetical protein